MNIGNFYCGYIFTLMPGQKLQIHQSVVHFYKASTRSRATLGSNGRPKSRTKLSNSDISQIKLSPKSTNQPTSTQASPAGAPCGGGGGSPVNTIRLLLPCSGQNRTSQTEQCHNIPGEKRLQLNQVTLSNTTLNSAPNVLRSLTGQLWPGSPI